MFTGIVEETGLIERLESKRNLSHLKVRAHKILDGLKKGDSVAVDGVCLTVVNIARPRITFDMMQETLVSTTLGSLKIKDKVNLERALKINDRLSGHFVTGHVDCVGVVKKRIVKKNYLELCLSVDKDLMRFIVNKGSVCVDGVSLTVGRVKTNYFSVYLIPFTNVMTTLGLKQEKDKVNIETDILAKYVLSNRGKRYT